MGRYFEVAHLNTDLNFPSGNPLDSAGNLTPQWRMFFLTLFTRTGGTSGNDTSTLQTAINAANANIADLQSEDGKGESTPDMAAVFGLIHVVEAIAAQAMAAASAHPDERGEEGDGASLTNLSQRIAELEKQLENRGSDDALRQHIADLESKIECMQPVIADASQMTGLGTMAAQNANAVAITGGSGAFSALSNTANTFIGNVAAVLSAAAGRIYHCVRGSTGAGGLELSSSAADADATLAGIVQFSDTNGTGNDKRLGLIQGFTSGSVANNRGGALTFATKTDGSGVAEAARFSNDQKFLIGSTAVDGSTNKVQVNSGISIVPATTTTAPTAGGAGALPATPTGYATFRIGGTDRKIAYY
jgi:hypothetical protein